MKTETVVYCVVALLLGMLLANMLKSVCGCKVVEGFESSEQIKKEGDAVAAVKHACGGTGYYTKKAICQAAVLSLAALGFDWFWDEGHASRHR